MKDLSLARYLLIWISSSEAVYGEARKLSEQLAYLGQAAAPAAGRQWLKAEVGHPPIRCALHGTDHQALHAVSTTILGRLRQELLKAAARNDGCLLLIICGTRMPCIRPAGAEGVQAWHAIGISALRQLQTAVKYPGYLPVKAQQVKALRTREKTAMPMQPSCMRLSIL